MADIKSFPNNQDTYVGAEWFMRWFHGRTSGVFGADGNAAVTAVQNSMAVNVSDGLGWMSNSAGDGIVWWNDAEQRNGSKLRLSVDLADGAFPRIDRVVVSWQTTNYVALPTITILKGTASSNPVAPALTNSTVLRQISLARILIPAAATSITPAMITDERLDRTVCGIVTESVSADTTTLNEQFNDLIEQLRYSIEQVIEGNVPAHAFTHASDGVDPLLPEDIGAVSSSGGTVSGQMHFNSGVGFGGSIYAYGNMVLSSPLYGDTLPQTGVEGQIFFLRA